MKTFTEFINDNNYSFDFDIENCFNDIASYIMNQFDDIIKNYDFSVCVTIVDEATIKSLNNENRNIDSITDVLSFPNIPFESEEGFDILNDSSVFSGVFDPFSGSVYLGDVVICYKRALEQAESYGHSVKREFCFLFAHSMLHLIGYDHIDEAERERMEEKQSLILNNLGITR